MDLKYKNKSVHDAEVKTWVFGFGVAQVVVTLFKKKNKKNTAAGFCHGVHVFLLLLVCVSVLYSAVQRSGVHQPVPFLGKQWWLRLGRDPGDRPLQQQDLAAWSHRLPELHTQVL